MRVVGVRDDFPEKINLRMEGWRHSRQQEHKPCGVKEHAHSESLSVAIGAGTQRARV